ncbi:MAG: MarR family winged helix-turn-helix transcriptional regulator [Candidatus Kerfeldbacteria bacterium]
MPIRRRSLIEGFIESTKAISNLIMAGKQTCYKHFNLHPAQARVLYYVIHNQPVTVKSIAAAMETTSSAATQIIDSIVRAGYLVRSKDRIDRRKVIVTLSAKGKAKFVRFRNDHLTRITAQLRSVGDRELKQVIALQRKVASDIRSEKS